MYLLEIKRDGNNPLTGRARYRVKYCALGKHIKQAFCQYWKKQQCLIISSARPYQEGSFVNPTAALKSSIDGL